MTDRSEQTRLKPHTNRNALYKPENGYVGGVITFPNHVRYNKTFDDCSAEVMLTSHVTHGWLDLKITETYEMANGNKRSNVAHVTLDADNVAALRDLLNKLDRAQNT